MLAGIALTKDNNTPIVLHALTPITTIIPLVVFALSSVAQYLKDNLQRIFRTILNFKLLVLPPTLAPAFQQYKSTYKRPLKAWFSNVYWGKTHLKCYNFFQHYKDYFAIAGAKCQNQVSFAVTFINSTALFFWQQY